MARRQSISLKSPASIFPFRAEDLWLQFHSSLLSFGSLLPTRYSHDLCVVCDVIRSHGCEDCARRPR